MSKIIYVCFKDSSRCNDDAQKKLERIAERITPDNINPRPPKIVIEGNVIYGIINPADSILENGKSVLLGMAFGDKDKWWEPGIDAPDGSFSIFRSNNETTELLTDVVASRTIWYYHDHDVFIASSSQRAIVMMLGSFNLNKQVFPWVLSTGSLGPYLSWDSRIKIVPPDSVGLLNHSSWAFAVNTVKIEFHAIDVNDKGKEEQLMTALTDTFKSLDIDFSKWVLPLSGGYDSRGILSLFNLIGTSLKKIRAVTWGLKAALNQPGNDASIAKKLADHYQLEHKYYLTDISTEDIEEIFSRYLICGEGRIDHVSGYMDGFKIWKTLYDDQVQGIIRGDVSFSSKEASSEFDIRKLQGIPLCDDFENLKGYESMGFLPQQLPDSLQRQKNENLQMWRDRLYHQFRIPIILAALNDLKLPYVEVINPLLSRRVVYQTRKMPDYLRRNKSSFKRIVNTISPNIEYATTGANANVRHFLKSKASVNLFTVEFNSESCQKIIAQNFLDYLLRNMKVTEDYIHKEKGLKAIILKYFPIWLIKGASGLRGRSVIDINVLAFRTYTISKMNKILGEDAAVFQQAE